MRISFHKYLVLISIAAIMTVLGSAPVRAAQYSRLGKPPLSERWFGIYVNNERCGFYRQVIAETPDGYRMEGDVNERLKVMWFSKEAASREVYQVNKSLALRSFEIEQNINGLPTRITGKAGDSILKLQIESGGKTTAKVLRFRGELFPGPALNLYPMMRGIQAGKTVKILTFDPEDIQVKEVAITVVGDEAAPDGQPALKLRNNLYPLPNDIWMDAQGNTILESVRDDLVITRAEDSRSLAAYVAALTISRKARISGFSLVQPAPSLKNQEKLRGLSLEISGWNSSLPLLQEGGQLVERAGEGKITVKTGTAVPTASQKGPASPAATDQTKYLKPAEGIESEAPEMVAQARKLAEGKKNGGEIARALVTWTTEWLKEGVDDGDGALASLLSRKGNCQTHARLYTALARAAGIPTRYVSGLVLLEGKGFFYHSWAESFLDGQWVAVDPTYNQMPADPTHLKFFEGHTREDLAPIASIIGKIGIRVLEAKY